MMDLESAVTYLEHVVWGPEDIWVEPLVAAGRSLLVAPERWMCGTYPDQLADWDTERDECGYCGGSLMSCGGSRVRLVEVTE